MRLATLALLGTLAWSLPVAADSKPSGTPADSVRAVPPLPPELVPVPFDSATTARYRETAAKLAVALAVDDARAFRALHTDAGWAQADDWWKALLANQKKALGKALEVVGPLRGVVRSGQRGVGVPPDGAAILLRMERGGASMSFVLDDSGRIVRSSVWVQRELRDAAPDGEILWSRAAERGGVAR